jgi:hypothetical protein
MIMNKIKLAAYLIGAVTVLAAALSPLYSAVTWAEAALFVLVGATPFAFWYNGKKRFGDGYEAAQKDIEETRENISDLVDPDET